MSGVEYACLGVVTSDGAERSAGGADAWASLAAFLGVTVAEVRRMAGDGELRAGGQLARAIETRSARGSGDPAVARRYLERRYVPAG